MPCRTAARPFRPPRYCFQVKRLETVPRNPPLSMATFGATDARVLPRIVWKIANKAVTSRDVTILHTPTVGLTIGSARYHSTRRAWDEYSRPLGGSTETPPRHRIATAVHGLGRLGHRIRLAARHPERVQGRRPRRPHLVGHRRDPAHRHRADLRRARLHLSDLRQHRAVHLDPRGHPGRLLRRDLFLPTGDGRRADRGRGHAGVPQRQGLALAAELARPAHR